MDRLVENFRSGLFCVVVPLEDIARSCFSCLFADSILQPRYCPLDPSHYRFILSAKKAQKGPVHESAYLRFRLPDHLPRDHLKFGIRPCVVHRPGISKTDTAYIARKDLLQKDWWAKLLDVARLVNQDALLLRLCLFISMSPILSLQCTLCMFLRRVNCSLPGSRSHIESA